MSKILQSQDKKEREAKIMSYYSTKKVTITIPKKKSKKRKVFKNKESSKKQSKKK